MNGSLVALLVGVFCGAVNLLIDIPALWNYDWSSGFPSYFEITRSKHRYLHTPIFCLLITIPLWIILIALVSGLRLGHVNMENITMNPILIYNLVFYLSPYVAMILYDLSTRTSNRNKATISIVLSIVLGSTFIYSLAQFLILGYTKNGGFVILFGFIPTYLALFYTASVIFCIIVLYLDGHPYYHSLFFGFLISYISSFYWELPENIFWQLKRGYHPAIIFTVLGVFPYIWLNKKLGWKKSRQNIMLLLLGWGFTTLGVLTLKTNVYTTPTEALYFLFCRVVGVLILMKIFLTSRDLGGLSNVLSTLKHIKTFSWTKLIIYTKWVVRYSLGGNWRLGTEIAYWDYEINHIRPEGWCLPVAHADIYHIIDEIKNKFKISGRDINVLELGPGPRSRLTELYDKEMFDLIAIDPLAEEFKKYFDGRAFLFQGYGENIDHNFVPESFHLSYASNSLDHSQDIKKCFANMVSLTKIGGYIMVQANIREGERLNWMGLHKYSTWIEEDDIMCLSREGEKFSLTYGVDIEMIIHREKLLSRNPWYSVVYRRVK